MHARRCKKVNQLNEEKTKERCLMTLCLMRYVIQHGGENMKDIVNKET